MKNTIWTSFLLGAAALSFASAADAAMTEADCTANWTAADVNNDGMVTEDESGRYFAYYRVGEKTVTGDKITREMFMADCQAGLFDETAAEAGAPFDGANSFTENQAMDRIVSRGMTDVSALTKDDKGIWRGTAKSADKQINVAVDYKGNVVATP